MHSARRHDAPSSEALPRLAGIPLAVVACLFLITYLGIALSRMAYPYELEWIESGSLQAMTRVLEHQPLYVRPSLEYVAFNYPPLYPWVGAVVARVTGEGFLPLRLVSFLSSLVAFGFAGWLVGRETRRPLLGLLTVGLIAAAFRISGGWYDIARADSLYLALLLAGFVALRVDRAPVRSGLIAGTAFTLAFLAKQSAAMVLLPMLAYLVWTDRLRCAALAATIVVGMGGLTLLLDRLSEGWYRYFLFESAVRHPMDPARILDFWPRDVIMPLGFALLIGGAHLMGWNRSKAAPAERGFYAAMLTGTLLSAWFHRMYPGGYENVLIPAYVTIAILFGLGLHEILEALDSGESARRIVVAVQVVVFLQFAALVYNPWAQLPREGDRAAGDLFVQKLREMPGRPLVPSHPYLVTRAGKPGHFHEMALIGLIEVATGEVETHLRDELQQAVRDTAFSVIVLSTRGWLGTTVQTSYNQSALLFTDPDAFFPVTGMRTRPEYVYLPRRTSLQPTTTR